MQKQLLAFYLVVPKWHDSALKCQFLSCSNVAPVLYSVADLTFCFQYICFGEEENAEFIIGSFEAN